MDRRRHDAGISWRSLMPTTSGRREARGIRYEFEHCCGMRYEGERCAMR